SFIIIFVASISVIFAISKILKGILFKETKRHQERLQKKIPLIPVKEMTKRQEGKKMKIDYRNRVKEITTMDPEFVASVLRKWLREK
ncbi:MAG: hypothetical protein AABZ11_11365, partial [Nitrospinota bacterium]